MDNKSIHERPGLHIGHLRQLVRLRKASGWLGILAVVATLVFYQLHRRDPALFEASRPFAMHGHPGSGSVHPGIWSLQQ
jgi:putative copper export protein